MLITLFQYMYFNCTDKFELFLFYCSSRFDINAISTMKPFLISQGKIVASSLGPHINLYGCKLHCNILSYLNGVYFHCTIKVIGKKKLCLSKIYTLQNI